MSDTTKRVILCLDFSSEGHIYVEGTQADVERATELEQHGRRYLWDTAEGREFIEELRRRPEILEGRICSILCYM